ncbi:hypothetical protein K431DRAFT_282977 [Polychaeton citri CBS 116435]|uniref:NAD(P)-binding domain-containing protein n=1 Tax=Polychaeton citri CBS 116435 TaxID=1314669 RepID=A0A9P4QBU3_9PEZI|nr:hypothetical protein K431DRAFT_282977 [Polychaeton citri CBS 116435]
MAHIILTGATGMAGAAILKYALASPSIAKVSIISRRPVELAKDHPKANVIVQKDFENYPSEILEQLKGATGCIWAQGISSNGMREDEYTKITVDYPLVAAKTFSHLEKRFNFVYMSGEGADQSERSFMMFGRVKGRAERELQELGAEQQSLSVYNVRPAMINPQGDYVAQRKVTLGDRTATVLGSVFGVIWKSTVIGTDKLAKVCVDLAVGEGGPVAPGLGIEADGHVLRNTALRRLAGK